MNNFSVKKWWGENAAELTKSPENVLSDYETWINQAIVVSAIRSPEFNTTDKLIELWEYLKSNKIEISVISEKIEEIKNFHFNIIDEKLSWDNNDIKEKVWEKFSEFMWIIVTWIWALHKDKPQKSNDYKIDFANGSISIIWFWEELSAFINSEVINKLWVDWLKSEVVDLQWVVNSSNEWLKDNELFISLSEEIKLRVFSVIVDSKIPVIPWYIPGFKEGIEKSVGRWYTDATASMTAFWLSQAYNVTLEIQKSVIWMLSADPRIVKEGTKIIEQIDYMTAKEITGIRGAQAKLLHSQVLRKELQEAGIDVRLFDPFSDNKWTLISKSKNKLSDWVEYIWWRENIIFFSVSCSDMSSEWILSWVFWIVKEYASVDIISTSETEISFTIDWWVSTKKLDEMSERIKKRLNIADNWSDDFVKYERNKALVFCVWQNLYHSKWSLGRAAMALTKWNINIEMVSQWTMERAMVFWIDNKKMKNAINLLHSEFIN